MSKSNKAPAKKPASKKAPAAPKGEPKTVEINPAVLASESQQRWKKRNGYCLVKGCREKADKGHFCSAHASARSRLKAKGEKLEDPIDFTPKPRGPKPVAEGGKKAPAKKAAPAKKSAGKPKSKKAPEAPAAVEPTNPTDLPNGAPSVETPADASLL